MMSSSVQALMKATAKSPSKSNSRCAAYEGDSDAFQAELGRASKRAEKKPAETSEEPKADKTSRGKKCESKGKSRKPEAAEEAPTDGVTEEANAAPTTAEPVAEDAAPVDEVAPVNVQEVLDLPEKEATPEVSPLLAMEAAAVAPTVQVDVQHVVETEDEAPVGATTNVVTPVKTQPTDLPEAGAAEAEATAEKAPIELPPELTEQEVASDEPEVAIKPRAKQEAAPEQAAVPVEVKTEAVMPEEKAVAAVKKDGLEVPAPQAEAPATKTANTPIAPKVPVAPPLPPEVRFAETNHTDIVRGIRTELLPRGGTMQIRLDPPELGALNVILSIKDGIATAQFQTTNDEATKLLSHSLSQLKSALENTGVTVDKLQVQQAPRNQESSDNKNDSQQRGQPGQDEMSRQQEQQRKEMLRRMWRRLNIGSDPLDLVA